MATKFSLSKQQLDKNQDDAMFCLETIKRDGIDSLIGYLTESVYFISPASTKYHNSFTGGLCLHSLNVMRMFQAENK
jgi:23S rRNA maturation-related 3'-5' exoribonuclease YhaM